MVLTVLREENELELAVIRGEVTVPSVEARELAPGVGYARITTVSRTTVAEFRAKVLEFGTLTGLVLDLRGNTGGTDSLGIHFAKHLVEGEFRYFLLSSKRDGAWPEPSGLSYRTEEGMSTYRGPLLALIDSGCFSTADNFLRCMDDLHPDFAAIGRPTAGGTGAPRVVARLEHSGAEVVLCTHRVFGPKGEPTEGRGTRPGVVVRWTRADVLAGRDPDLEAALARIDSRKNR